MSVKEFGVEFYHEKVSRDLGSGFVGFEFNTYQTSFCWQKTKAPRRCGLGHKVS